MPRGACRAVAALTAAVALAGCSQDDEGAPAACAGDPETITDALENAPEPVRLEGGVAISDCFARDGDAGHLQTIGFTLTEAVTRLAREARSDPEGQEAVELGYLIGASRHGAETVPTLYDELLRRLEQELRGVDTSSEAFATGLRAGAESG